MQTATSMDTEGGSSVVVVTPVVTVLSTAKAQSGSSRTDNIRFGIVASVLFLVIVAMFFLRRRLLKRFKKDEESMTPSEIMPCPTDSHPCVKGYHRKSWIEQHPPSTPSKASKFRNFFRPHYAASAPSFDPSADLAEKNAHEIKSSKLSDYSDEEDALPHQYYGNMSLHAGLAMEQVPLTPKTPQLGNPLKQASQPILAQRAAEEPSVVPAVQNTYSPRFSSPQKFQYSVAEEQSVATNARNSPASRTIPVRRPSPDRQISRYSPANQSIYSDKTLVEILRTSPPVRQHSLSTSKSSPPQKQATLDTIASEYSAESTAQPTYLQPRPEQALSSGWQNAQQQQQQQQQQTSGQIVPVGRTPNYAFPYMK